MQLINSNYKTRNKFLNKMLNKLVLEVEQV